MLPHTNLGVLSKGDLARLREVTASQGLMLESTAERLMKTVHAGSPTKHPAQRLATIEAAGELKIPFTSGILVGIGETEEERVEALEALAGLHERYGHLQEVILQNFVPHPKYYGAEVADIADQAARERWSGGGDPLSGATDGEAPERGSPPPMPSWASSVGIEEIKRLIGESKRLMPDVGVQIPPNLSDWWPGLVEAGATDLGGCPPMEITSLQRSRFPAPTRSERSLLRVDLP